MALILSLVRLVSCNSTNSFKLLDFVKKMRGGLVIPGETLSKMVAASGNFTAVS